MDDTTTLMSIGAFARQVGITPSALRFYDDCGLLRAEQSGPRISVTVACSTEAAARSRRVRLASKAAAKAEARLVVQRGEQTLTLEAKPEPNASVELTGSDQNPDDDRAGNGWFGLVRNQDFVVTGIDQAPLLPPWVALLIATSLLLAAWRREGR